MKILVALNNSYVKNELEKIYGNDVYTYDITEKEAVIEFLANNLEAYTIITKDDLEGKINKEMYIKQMKLANSNIKIIYIVEKLDEKYKQFLFANEVFNIIEGNIVSTEKICNLINSDNKIVYKYESNASSVAFNEAAQKYYASYKTNLKKLVAVYGTSGAGKSFISSVLSKELAKSSDINISLLDMDVQNPAIDIFNSLKYNNSLSHAIDDIDNNIELNKFLEKYMIKDGKNKKLWYMPNNVNLFDFKSKLSSKNYEKIYESVRCESNFTFVDLPSSPFLDVVPYTLEYSDIIFFVINPNYISIRQACKYLEIFTKVWDIKKEKINIIVNKYQKDSLDFLQINSLLKGYNIVLMVPFVEKIDSYINGATQRLEINFDFKKVYKSLDLEWMYEINYNKKGKILPGMFKALKK